MSYGIFLMEKGSEDYNMLELLALRLTQKSPNHYKYYVGETYFDYGANMMWTTVLCNGDWCSYQALNPVEQETILLYGVSMLDKLVEDIFNDKYCPDKVKVCVAS